MLKKRLSLLLVFVMAICFTMASVNSHADAEGSGKIFTVKQDGNGDYTTISAAVKNVQAGDTVEIYGGTYREEVVIPRGGNGESSRVTLKAASGQKVIITGSDIVNPEEWTQDSGNVYTLVKANSYFGDFNPFSIKWQKKGFQYSDYFICGCVYINGIVLSQVFKKDDVYTTPNSWFAEVTSDKTTISVNFGGLDPTDLSNSTEINVRKQCVSAAWNQGYITIDGLTAIHGCGPKTTGFAKYGSKPMEGAIATNGGYYWIIENCELYQNRGVAIDFGLGSRDLQNSNGGEPKLYGHHIIRYCNVHDNGTNGVMAYRGAYTEMYGCVLANNNALNTGLTSEGFFKNVNSGFGINIHDNYFYSDQNCDTYPIWLDCESDGSRITRNIFYSAGPNGKGLSVIFWEQGGGWNLCANNIFVSAGINIHCSTNTFVVNNLFLNNTKGTYYPGNPKAYKAYGYNGYSRVLRAMKPGTLTPISTVNNPTSHFETYLRFNKLYNNIFFGEGLTGAKEATECSNEEYNGIFAEFINVGDNTKDIWQAVYEGTDGKGTISYGNECDYNVYYGGAEKIDYQYASAHGYEADKNSKVVAGSEYSYHVTGDKNSFALTLTVDDTCSAIKAPAITSEYLGNAALYASLGYDFYAPNVDTDFYGDARDSKNTIVGPFAHLKAGSNMFKLWPHQQRHNLNGVAELHHR
jgi:alpha-N-arabinofuranosidase